MALGQAAVRLLLGEDSGRPEDGRVVASLAGAIAGACREGLPDEEVAPYLRSEHLLPPGAADRVAEALKANRPRVQRALDEASGSTCLPRLGSATWRLDVVRKGGDRGVEPVFHVSLAEVRGEGLSSFACNMEEMQDLVATLKDACLSMRRNETAHA